MSRLIKLFSCFHFHFLFSHSFSLSFFSFTLFIFNFIFLRFLEFYLSFSSLFSSVSYFLLRFRSLSKFLTFTCIFYLLPFLQNSVSRLYFQLSLFFLLSFHSFPMFFIVHFFNHHIYSHIYPFLFIFTNHFL